MFARLLQRFADATHAIARTIYHRLLAVTKPASAPFGVGTLADLVGSPQ